MIESIPQLNPDRPPPDERAAQERDELFPPAAPALTGAQIRTLALGFAGFEMLTVFGVWSILLEGSVPGWFIALGVVPTVLAGWGAWYFLGKLRRVGPVTPGEPRVMIGLLVNFLWPAIPTGIAAAHIRNEDPFLLDELFTGTSAVVIAFLCVLVFHGVPAMLIAAGFRRRIGTDDSTWLPQQSNTPERTGALFGVSMLVGGWTAAGGICAYVAVWDLSGASDPFEFFYGLGFLNFALVGGMFCGFCCSLFSALVPSDTRLDKSVPVLFLTVMGMGVLASAINPMLGVLAAGTTAIAMSFFVKSRYKLIPLGQCQRCAYDLHGLDTETCPECGYEHRPHELPRRDPTPAADAQSPQADAG